MSIGGAEGGDDAGAGDVTLTGVLQRRQILSGSHSERPAIVLVGDDGSAHRLHLLDENPLEQPTLASLEGRRVTVAGTLRNGVLRVSLARLRVHE